MISILHPSLFHLSHSSIPYSLLLWRTDCYSFQSIRISVLLTLFIVIISMTVRYHHTLSLSTLIYLYSSPSTNTLSEYTASIAITLLLNALTLVLDVARKIVGIYPSNKNLTLTWRLNRVREGKGVLTKWDSTGWQIGYIYFMQSPQMLPSRYTDPMLQNTHSPPLNVERDGRSTL